MSLKNTEYTLLLLGMLALLILLVGCSTEGGDLPTPTSIVTENTREATDDTARATPVPTPTTPPRRLTICMADEPASLFIYGADSLAQRHVLQAIHDGPVDMIEYQLQPVLLEKLPSLADGDATLEPVPVDVGDLIVNASGQVVRLESGESLRPFGCLSQSCEITWDGSPLELPQLSATFTIKPGIQWSEGTPLTAADSVFSYQVAAQCETDFGPCGGLGLSNRSGWEMLPRTASYTAVDDHSLVWTGLPGYLDPAYQSNFFIPLPEHQLADYSLPDLFSAPEASRQPLGWGPYAVQSWVAGESISLRPNPNYPGEVKYDELRFRFIGRDASNLDLIQSGACDLIEQTASRSIMEVSFQELTQLDASGELKVFTTPATTWEHADFGILPLSYDDGYLAGVDRPDFFGDARVRQAFAMCMNRERIVEEMLHGLSAVPGTYLPQGHPLENPQAVQYAFDPASGGQLLQEAGWVDHDANPQTPRQAAGIQGIVDGTPFEVSYTTSQSENRMLASQVLAESLAECGIGINLDYGPAEQVFVPGPEGPVFGRRFDLAQFAWSPSYQPACHLWVSSQVPGDPLLEDEDSRAVFPYGWGGVNIAGFRDSEFDRACELALRTLPGQEGYIENQYTVQEIFAEQLPSVPLYQHVSLALSRADMCGFSFDATAYSELWNIENFDHGPDCQ